jgi:hypothetical protein
MSYRFHLLCSLLISTGCALDPPDSDDTAPLTAEVATTWTVPSLYADWGLPTPPHNSNGLYGYYNIDANVVVTRDPGPDATVFFASQFFFTGTSQGGYMGIQDGATLASGATGKLAIFSIWGATGGSCTEGKPVFFTETTSGYSCHLDYPWVENHTYRMRVWALSGTEWQSSVTDLTTGAQTIIGNLDVPASYQWLAANPASFSEDFAENGGLTYSSCEAVPVVAAIFDEPTANDDTVATTAGSTSTQPGATCTNTASVLAANHAYALHEYDTTNQTDVAVIGRPGGGYYTVAAGGGVYAYGAPVHGNVSGALVKPIVAAAATPSGNGYWLAASDGGIFTFGDAGFYGSMGGQHLNAPIVGMARSGTGHGYWLVASDGGIFSFGDAAFHGSMGGQHLNAPVVGMAATPSGGGYWLVGSDGGIFSFGNAAFYGSEGGAHLNAPITGMVTTSNGGGYWLVARDGGIFSFGNAAFYGSEGGKALVGGAPIVGMATTPSGNGYWLVGSNGHIYPFGGASYTLDGAGPLFGTD